MMNVNKDFFLAKDGHPSLKQFYFIGAPFEKALDLYLKRLMDLSDFYQNLKPKLSYLDEEYTLSQKLDFLNPLEITGSSKYLLLETQSDWSLLIDNNRNGTDFSSVPYEALLWKIRLLTMYLRPYFAKMNSVRSHLPYMRAANRFPVMTAKPEMLCCIKKPVVSSLWNMARRCRLNRQKNIPKDSKKTG